MNEVDPKIIAIASMVKLFSSLNKVDQRIALAFTEGIAIKAEQFSAYKAGSTTKKERAQTDTEENQCTLFPDN